MDIHTFDAAIHEILAVLPECNMPLARLRAIVQAGQLPTVTVIGKYNHGKSRLLNELIGDDIFSVADKRETVTLSEHLQHNIRWLDAPGLGADVATIDDQHAQDAMWNKADIRLMIHSVREGEFDPYELLLFQQFEQDATQTQRQSVLVLTQIDQIPDQTVLAHIIDSIQKQAPAATVLPVSATRHRQGIENSKTLLVQRSGIPELQQTLSRVIEKVPAVRQFEKNKIFTDLTAQLSQLQQTTQANIQQLSATLDHQRQAFEHDLNQVLDKVREDLQPILHVSGQDDSLEPDSFANMYKVTAGKRDRNRIQVAYSRACIEINSHLVRYGVVSLPDTHKSNVRSLDTVMVAVMGISVKLRKDLKLIFEDESGRQRLRREFAHYFEVSADRMHLKEQLQDSQQQLQQIQQAQHASATLELAS
ncbi:MULTISPECIES: GTPase [Acinetobacter]|jgi:GTP-binding protein EngB required for normal cell division|uniref:GTPase n=1 Tax=Acinetobacter TaxID=469 RepID=UPI000277C3D0|nr:MULTISPECIES: GTPase [Acinetobacter]EJO35739.1 AIG1 family protein [Acinetobacter radioresistens WC-A-157]